MSPVGLICALPAEAKAFAGRAIPADSIVHLDPFLIAVTGMGAERARGGIDRLLAMGARTLVSWGTAAALMPGLRPGDLLLPDTVRYGATDLKTDPNLRQRLVERLPSGVRVVPGTLVQAATVIRTPEDKQQLHTQTGAAAVDMESGEVAVGAEAAAVPFLVVRAIVDTCDIALPDCVVDATDEFGRTDAIALLAGLVKQPGALIHLCRLGVAFRSALATLRATAPTFKASLPAI